MTPDEKAILFALDRLVLSLEDARNEVEAAHHRIGTMASDARTEVRRLRKTIEDRDRKEPIQ